jgi:YVTN family beta-propeller protein
MNTYEPGTEIAGYRIESMIGRGGMAVVYRAEDTRLGRKVALKLLTPQLADSEQFRQRFIRESRLAASLDHPNIVPIYEAGEADGQLFIAMRYVLGPDLKGLLAEHGGQLPLEWTLPLFRQIGRALDAAHRAGLVHRDVKPGNILVTNEERPRSARGGHVYLTDFGLTKRASELSGGLTGTGHFLGTVDYVAPEQIQGKPVGSATDIYALGCVLYECLTGQLPFRRDDDAALLWAHLVEAPPPVAAVRPEIPEAVDAVVARAMAKDSADRYESCEELLRDLEPALALPAHGSVAPVRPTDGGGAVPARRTEDGGAATVASTPSHAGVAVGYSLAIDLGTSFIAAAVADDRGREMFGLGDGALVAPAAVFVRDDGRLVTGDAAARRAVSHPDRVAREVKRHLGNPTPMILGGAPYAVSDLLGAQLQDVLGRVAEQQGAKPEVVALTHPANWGPFRREQFEDVARSAGITEPLYTTEPEAAAAHYASTRPLAEGEVLAVYDLGGGTFDATVLRRTAHGFQILGTPEGIERLGGADFDDAVFAHVNYLAGGALGELDLSDSRTSVAVARLRQDCTLAKEALSVETEATIPVFLPNRHFDITLTRAELEGMIRAPIESTIGTLDRVLRAAQVDRSDLAAVLLVGGSSRIPLIAQMVSEAFGRPTAVSAHPKHAVALGAALLAEARRTKSPVALLADDAQTAVGSSIVVVGPGEAVSRETPAPPSADGSRAPKPVAVPAAASAAAPAAVLTSSSARHAAPVAPDVQPPSQVPQPRGAEPSGGAPLHGSPVAGPPPVEPPPTAARPAAVPSSAPQAPWWSRYLAFLVGLVLLATGAGVIVYLSTRPGGGAGADQGGQASPTTEAPAPVAPPAPATAVPIPSIGATVPAGDTPGFVAAAPNGRQLYVANREAGVVTVVDTAVNTVTATIEISDGPPQFIAFSPDGRRAYVSVWDEARTVAEVIVLDTTTNEVEATIPVETRPFLAAVSPDGKWLYVPNHDNDSVSVIDTSTNELVTNFTVAPNPHWVAFTPDGKKLYTANHDSNLVSAIDPSTNEVITEIPTPTSPHSIDVHPTEPLVIVACFDADQAVVINTDTDEVVATVDVGPDPQYAEWSADGRFAYIVNNDDNTVSVVDGKTFAVTATIPTGASPTSMGIVPDGSRGYVSNLNDGTLTELTLAG